MSKSYWMENQNGNFTKDKEDTFDPKKRYIGVRMQQGVPLLDRDWNELEDIRRYEEQMLRQYYIGNGSPDGGFKISACDPPENDFIVGTGRCIVDGFEVINDPNYFDESVNKYTEQQKIDSSIPNLNSVSYPNHYRVDTVYLDTWIEEVTSQGVDDPLNNPHDLKEQTTIRHKLMWRVRVDEGSKGNYKKKLPAVKSATIEFVDYYSINQDKFPIIDLFAEEYVPLKSNDPSKLAKLILDSDQKHSLIGGEKLDLGSGYVLEVKQVNVDDANVWLEFSKDGKYVDDQIVDPEKSDGNWTAEIDKILDEDNVPVLRVHVNRIFQGADSTIVEIDGIWLIDYVNAKILNIEDKFGDYTLTEIIAGTDESNRGSLIFQASDDFSKPNQDYEYHRYYDIARIKRKSEKGNNEIQDTNIEDLREARGEKLFDNIKTQSLTFKSNQVPSDLWPKMTCEAANQLALSGDLIIKASNKGGKLNAYPFVKLDMQGNIKLVEPLTKRATVSGVGTIWSSQNSIMVGGEDNAKAEALIFNISKTNPDTLIEKCEREITVGKDWTINATIKDFLIDHPLHPDTHDLIHSTLEGPEIAVFYRGEAQLSNGKTTILLPDYFEALTRKENRTVLLTPKFEEDMKVSMLATSNVTEGKFTVKMIDSNNPSQKFYWEVKAVRADVEKLEVEREKF